MNDKNCPCRSKPERWGWVYMGDLLYINPAEKEAKYCSNTFFTPYYYSKTPWNYCPYCGRKFEEGK